VWKEPTGVAVGITPWNYPLIKKALTTARGLRAGIVWINDTQPAPTEMPWGGYQQSGIGRELGKDGVEDYLEKKSVYVNLA